MSFPNQRYDIGQLRNVDKRNRFIAALTAIRLNANDPSIDNLWENFVQQLQAAAESTFGLLQLSTPMSQSPKDTLTDGVVNTNEHCIIEEYTDNNDVYSPQNLQRSRFLIETCCRHLVQANRNGDRAAINFYIRRISYIDNQMQCLTRPLTATAIALNSGDMTANSPEAELNYLYCDFLRKLSMSAISNAVVLENTHSILCAFFGCDVNIQTSIEEHEPTRSEIINAISSMSLFRAPGIDGLHAEFYSVNLYEMAPKLSILFRKMWSQCIIPKSWRNLYITCILKSDGLLENKIQYVVNAPVAQRVYETIILRRLHNYIIKLVRREWSIVGRYTKPRDNLATLSLIMDRYEQSKQSLYMAFIDFSDIAQSLNREILWRTLSVCGIPTRIVNILQSLYIDLEASISHRGLESPKIPMANGLAPSSPLTPVLINVLVDRALKFLDSPQYLRHGIRWGENGRLTDIYYGDKLVLLSNSSNGIQEMLTALEAHLLVIGGHINEAASECLIMNDLRTINIQYMSKNLMKVSTSTSYLGHIVTTDGHSGQDLKITIDICMNQFQRLMPLWKNQNYPKSDKLEIFNRNIMPNLLRNCQSWRLLPQHYMHLANFMNSCMTTLGLEYIPGSIQDSIFNEINRWLNHVLCRKRVDTTVLAILNAPINSWRINIENRLGCPLAHRRAYILRSNLKVY